MGPKQEESHHFSNSSLVAEHSAPSACYVWYIHEELCKKVMNQRIQL